jgi:hypothetical protein
MTSNASTGGSTAAVAVVGLPADPAGDALRAYVASHVLGEAPTWFAPRDLNDLEDAIEAGRFERVVFATPGDFLEAVWNGEIRPAAWRKAGVRVEFAERSAPGDDATRAWSLAERYEAWRARRRQAAIVSAVVLSAIAIAAAFALIWAA